jgi:hypothetical protein
MFSSKAGFNGNDENSAVFKKSLFYINKNDGELPLFNGQ